MASQILDTVSEPDACPLCHTKFPPGELAAHIQLGFIFLSRNTPKAAVDIFTDAERLFPGSLVVRLGKGLAQKDLQLYDEAEATLAHCWPHPLAFDALATVLVQRAKFEQVSRRPPSYPPRTRPPVSYGAWP